MIERGREEEINGLSQRLQAGTEETGRERGREIERERQTDRQTGLHIA